MPPNTKNNQKLPESSEDEKDEMKTFSGANRIVAEHHQRNARDEVKAAQQPHVQRKLVRLGLEMLFIKTKWRRRTRG